VTDISAVDIDQALPLQLSVEAQSPHVFAYRFWYQVPGGTEWVKCGEGHTADNTPDSFSIPVVPAGTTISYWLAAAGHPSTAYRVQVTMSQDGKPVGTGTMLYEGTTSASGGAVVQGQVALA